MESSPKKPIFEMNSDSAALNLVSDNLKNYVTLLNELINRNLSVLIMVGEFDMKDGPLS